MLYLSLQLYREDAEEQQLPGDTLDKLWQSLRDTDNAFVTISNEYQEIYTKFTERQQVMCCDI